MDARLDRAGHVGLVPLPGWRAPLNTATVSKVQSLAELAETCAALRARGHRIVLCHGVFDLMHPGHIKHFDAARRLGDVLLVTITRDEHVNKGPGRPVFNQRLRAESVAALAAVDYVAINEWPTAVDTIRLLRPDVYVKGSDYADAAKDLTGGIRAEAEAVEAVGGRIHFTTEVQFSSTQLLNSHFAVLSDDAINFLRQFRGKHGSDEIVDRLKALQALRVLVIGETIVDEYCYSLPVGKSPKDTFVVAKYQSEEAFAGGAAAVANHVAGFCRSVDLVTCIGSEDSRESFLRARLAQNVTPHLFTRPGAPTIVKRRFVEPAFLKKMFEICWVDDSPLPAQLDADVCHLLREAAGDYDLVLVADFGHGFIGRAAVDVLAGAARFLAVNTQMNSLNSGYNVVGKYPRADYVCVDEPEIRLANRDRHTPLRQLVECTAAQLGCSRMAITRGARGAAAYAPDCGYLEVPVFSDKVIDTVGAGDAFLAVTAPCAAVGLSPELIGFVGNAVGALAVKIVGNRSSVDPVGLYRSIQALLG